MQSTPHDELRRLVLKCRAEQRLSLSAMGVAVGLSAAGISKIERGKTKPNRASEARLIEFLRKRGYLPKAAA